MDPTEQVNVIHFPTERERRERWMKKWTRPMPPSPPHNNPPPRAA